MQEILLIDDDDLFAEFVVDAAELIGAKVTTISNGQEIEQQNCSNFDYIIVDLSIPGYDGVQLLRWLKDHNCESSIIIASGCESSILNSAKQLAESYDLNLVATLNKPFPLNSLLDALKIKSSANIKTTDEDESLSDEEIVIALSEAIDNKEIEVYYQPKFNLKDRRLIGFETLARWTHQGHTITPSVFIPLAEQYSLIDKLTYLIIDLALPKLAQICKGNFDLQMAINFSARSLNQLSIPDYLEKKVEQNNLLPKQIIIELTESALAEDKSSSLEILTRMRMKGFNLSIDDFGTGYSSVQQLQKIPFNELKIDRSFICDFLVNPPSRTIIMSTIEMAHNLGIKVVAEGIEDPESIDALIKLGCDVGQGFYYAKPMASEPLDKWLKANPAYLNTDSAIKSDNFTICAVDDDVDFLELLNDVLADEFQFTSFTSAEHFLSQANTLNPCIVLLDINMPNMDGFEVCQHLKKQGVNSSIIFVSGANTKEQKLKAYAAGGDDFITKPVQLGEMLAKLRALQRYQKDKETLQEQGDMAQDMVFQSMTEAAQYGSILRFFKDSFACRNHQQLAELFFSYMAELQLSCCIQFRSSYGIHSYGGENQQCSPMEENLFEMLLPSGRLYHFKNRTMVNDEHVSFLIKNMPVDDEVSYGRYNDIIAALIEGLEAKWRDLIRERSANELVANIDDILLDVKEKFANYGKEAHQVIDMLILDVRSSLHVLDLSEEQENYLISLIECGVDRVMVLGDAGKDIEININQIIEKFKVINN